MVSVLHYMWSIRKNVTHEANEKIVHLFEPWWANMQQHICFMEKSGKSLLNYRKMPALHVSLEIIQDKTLFLLQAPVHRSTSYGDFEGTTSSATSSSMFNIPRIRTDIYSTSSSTHTLEDPRKHRKTRETSSDETGTSGYSTNSISELSEFSSAYRSDKGKLQVPKSGGKRRQSSDEKGSKSSTDRVSDRDRGSKSSTERLSDRDRGSKCSTERLSDRDSKHSDRKLNKRRESNLSVNDSVTSLSSSREQTRKAKETGKSVDSKLSSEITQKAPTIGNVAVTVTNNIQYDPNDPFSFIQPVDLPFHVKVRKCMGPILAVILLLIVAVSLGAAIYFAAALKGKFSLKTRYQPKQSKIYKMT